MAIQFRCPGCSQPIEVDDIHAGQTAACPYCRRVVNVPTESALDQPAPTAARPTAGTSEGHAGAGPGWLASREAGTFPTPQPTPGELHVGPTRSPRELAAARYGTFGLICSALVLLMFAGMVVIFMGVMLDEMGGPVTSQPSAEEMAQIQSGALERLYDDSRVAVLRVGAALFALAGLVFGIVSVVQHRQNWKGIVSLVLCGLFALCTCGDLLSLLFSAAAVTLVGF
jgi:hypothetical protein